MKRAWLAAAVCAAAMPASCESDEPQTEASLLPADHASFPEVRGCRFSVDHDAIYVRVFTNPQAQAAYTDGVYPFAPGTVLLKHYYRDAGCTDLQGYGLMQRLDDGEAPEQLDWHWQELDADGKVQAIEVAACVSCHDSCTAGRDGACTDP
ncbi:MAG: cytochrome P460 family protein [Nannocystaceae bacterium]|nr:cytochrome P460 family protein [Nannocystaceae bacterium]